MTELDHIEDHDAAWLAAEYALGVLDAPARRAAALRMEQDAAFAEEVRQWEARLSGMIADYTEVEPPAALWGKIAASLSAVQPRRVEVSASRGLWNSLPFWRFLAGGSLSAAAACLLVLMVAMRAPDPGMTMAATLNSESGSPLMMVALDARRGAIMVMPASASAPAQRVPELWIIPPGGSPQSLGVVSMDRPMLVPLPEGQMKGMNRDAILAVSLEPAGGSPTGQPTGPVIAQGKMFSL